MEDENAKAYRLYREAGHATMYYLLIQGISNEYVPLGKDNMLASLVEVSVETEEHRMVWDLMTPNLGSMMTNAQVLLAGRIAERIKFPESPEPTKYWNIIQRANHLIAAYLEEYLGDNTEALRERDRLTPEWMQKFSVYVEQEIRLYWSHVEALVTRLQQDGTLTKEQVFEVLQKAQ